jgi:hypothetical protein
VFLFAIAFKNLASQTDSPQKRNATLLTRRVGEL